MLLGERAPGKSRVGQRLGRACARAVRRLRHRPGGQPRARGVPSARIADFEPCGYDERLFSSPGFNLPVGRLTRSPSGEYPASHTSADNLDILRPFALT